MKRTILLTGGSSGIGLASCKQLLSDGHRVVTVSRTRPEYQHERMEALCCDLSDLDNLPKQLTVISDRYPDIDTLVLCAGKGLFGSLEEFSYRQMQQLMDLNFHSQAFCARHFLPGFKRRKQGDMIFIGSEAALAGKRKGSLYCASKFALRGFTQALRDECARSGVRVSLVNPGMTLTPFFDDLSFGPGEQPTQHMQAEDIARIISEILATRLGTVIDEINLSPLNHVVQPRKGWQQPD